MRGGKTKDEARVVSLNQEVRQMLGLVPRNGEYVFGGTRPVGSFRKAWASAGKAGGRTGDAISRSAAVWRPQLEKGGSRPRSQYANERPQDGERLSALFDCERKGPSGSCRQTRQFT